MIVLYVAATMRISVFPDAECKTPDQCLFLRRVVSCLGPRLSPNTVRLFQRKGVCAGVVEAGGEKRMPVMALFECCECDLDARCADIRAQLTFSKPAKWRAYSGFAI